MNKTTDAHILVRLTYASRANPDIKSADVDAILAQARENNDINGITGSLTFNKQFFLQTVEGPRAQINRLLLSLLSDQRHHDLQVFETSEINMREWSDWSMNYASPSESNRACYLKYSTTIDFNPFLLNAESARALLRELRVKRSVATALKNKSETRST